MANDVPGPPTIERAAKPFPGPPLRPAQWLAALIAAIAIALAIASVPFPEQAATLRAAAVLLLCAGLWATGAVPEFYTSVIFFFCAIVLGVAPPAVVFSGFHASAIWLVFGGLVIARAVSTSGLGERVVRALLSRFPMRRYVSLLYAVTLAGVVLAVFIPSAVARVVMLVPIALAVADGIGFGERRNGRAGLVAAAALGTTMPSFSILPSNVPNMVLTGAAESVYGVTFTYGAYLTLNFTVMGVLFLLSIAPVVALALPDAMDGARVEPKTEPLGTAERKLLFILLLTVALWASDSLHGISPAWVSLGAAVACLSPRVGVLPTKALVEDINYGIWLFVAGVVGFGAVATHSGFGPRAAEVLAGLVGLTPGYDAWNYAALVVVGTAVSLVGTHPSAPAIMTPLAEQFATSTGWSLMSVLMAQVAAWAVFLVPYQVPPVLVGLTLGGVAVSRAVRVLAILAVLVVAVILPLHFFWGRMLGFFGGG